MNIGLWLAQTAQHMPDQPALFLGRDQVANYAEFHDASARLAGWLKAQGITAGDRVALFMKNCPDYLICLHAVW